MDYSNLHKGQHSSRLLGNLRMLMCSTQHTGERSALWIQALFYGKLPEGKTSQVLMQSDALASPVALKRIASVEAQAQVLEMLISLHHAGQIAEVLKQYLDGSMSEAEFKERLNGLEKTTT